MTAEWHEHLDQALSLSAEKGGYCYGMLTCSGQHLALLGDTLLHCRNVRIQNLHPCNTKQNISSVDSKIII